jgi:hypothetical protein
MDAIAHIAGQLVEGLLVPLDGLAAWASLAIVAVITAIAMLLVVRWTSPQRTLERARARMAAAIFEMRLYLDHPRQLLWAQGGLVKWTAIYLACLLPSAVVLAAPLGLLYLHLEIRHQHAPFTAPTSAIVRFELDGDLRELAIDPRPAARVNAQDEQAVYARIPIASARDHVLTARTGTTEVPVVIAADPRVDVVSPERRRGVAQLWTPGAEPPLDGAIRRISIQYPERSAALAVPWWLYWLGGATVVALLLRRRFGVVL